MAVDQCRTKFHLITKENPLQNYLKGKKALKIGHLDRQKMSKIQAWREKFPCASKKWVCSVEGKTFPIENDQCAEWKSTLFRHQLAFVRLNKQNIFPSFSSLETTKVKMRIACCSNIFLWLATVCVCGYALCVRVYKIRRKTSMTTTTTTTTTAKSTIKKDEMTQIYNFWHSCD